MNSLTKNPILKYFLLFWLITSVLVISLMAIYFVKDGWRGAWRAEDFKFEDNFVGGNIEPAVGGEELDASCKKIGTIDSQAAYSCYEDGAAFVLIDIGGMNFRFDVGQANIIFADGKYIYVWNRDADKYWIVSLYDATGKVVRTLPKIQIPNEGYPSKQTLVGNAFVVLNEKVCREAGAECSTPEDWKKDLEHLCSGIPSLVAFNAVTGKQMWLNDTPLLSDVMDDPDMVITNADEQQVVKLARECGKGDSSLFVSYLFDIENGELKYRETTNYNYSAYDIGLSIIESPKQTTFEEIYAYGNSEDKVTVDTNWLEYTVHDGLKFVPALKNNVLIIASPAKLTAIDFQTKKIIWKKELNYFGTLKQASNNGEALNIGLYVRTADSKNSENCAAASLGPECYPPERDAELDKNIEACLKELKESKVQLTAIDLVTGDTLWTYESNEDVVEASAFNGRVTVTPESCGRSNEIKQLDCHKDEPIYLDLITGKEIK